MEPMIAAATGQAGADAICAVRSATVGDNAGMPLIGEYEPGTSPWSRKHVEDYEATNGEKAGDLRGRPVIVLTSVGARSGKLRKTALMRVEHDGQYAVVASLGGSPHNPKWYYNLATNPHVELQDGAIKRALPRARSDRRREGRLVGTSGRDVARLRQLPEEDPAPDPPLRARADALTLESLRAAFTIGAQLDASLTLIGSTKGSTHEESQSKWV